VIARRLAALLGVVTLVGSAWWMLLYLSRWEWHRAITAGIFLIAAEVALVGGAILARLSRVEDRVDHLAATRQAAVDDTRLLLRASRSPGRSPFAWLEPDPGRTSVFVPILMGAGFLLSGLAWLVERLARVTARPALERDLAERLSALAPPVTTLVPDREELAAHDDPAARLSRPTSVV
jgi:hypothetical protein